MILYPCNLCILYCRSVRLPLNPYVRNESVEHGTVPGPRAACGYSFGAATALRAALRTPGIERLVLAAPPTALLPERALAEFRGPIFVVVGDRDEWVDLDRPDLHRHSY